MNPRYGDFDTYHMAASAIDEAVRNCVAVGADPRRIAILDNFCWGDCERPETLGSLVRAALACHDVALALGTPFISGKDSLNNEFSYIDAAGERQSIAIPPTLLISALGQIDDVAQCVTMDLKEPGNLLYLVGETQDELGGSHFALVHDLRGGQVPTVDPALAKRTFAAVHAAIDAGLVRACHDLSEGGLAVAAAEMAFAGGCGASVDLARAAPSRTKSPLSANRIRASSCESRAAAYRRVRGTLDAVSAASSAGRRRERRRAHTAAPARRERIRADCTAPEREVSDRAHRCLLQVGSNMTARPRVLILRAPGTNCDAETAFAFETCGRRARAVAREPSARASRRRSPSSRSCASRAASATATTSLPAVSSATRSPSPGRRAPATSATPAS